MSLFGLTWLFAALTVTGFRSAAASTAFQVLFVIFNAFQGFFIFLFFCVFSKDARDAWLNLVSCSHHVSKSLHLSQLKYDSVGANPNVKTASIGLTDSKLTSAISSKSGYTLSAIDMPLTSVAEQKKENPPVLTFKDDPKIPSTNKKVDLRSSEVKEKAGTGKE